MKKLSVKKIVTITSWEFKRQAFTRGWTLSLFLLPIILFYVFHFSVLFKKNTNSEVLYLVGLITDEPYSQLQFISEKDPVNSQKILFIKLQNISRSLDSSKAVGYRMLKQGNLDGLLMFAEGKSQYYCTSVPDEMFLNELRFEVLKAQVNRVSFGAITLNIEKIFYPETKVIRFNKAEKMFEFETGEVISMLSHLSLLFFMSLSFVAGIVIRSFQEEKSNKLIEVLLSSTTAAELSIGKYVSLFFIAGIQLFSWLAITLGLYKMYGIALPINSDLALIILTQVCGLLFFIALYLLLGIRQLRESSTQFTLSFFSLVIFIPNIFATGLVIHGDSSIIHWLGYIPLFTSITTVMQICVNNFSIREMVIQNGLLLINTILLLYPLTKSAYNPFGMFGNSVKIHTGKD